MTFELITRRDDLLIRRLTLAPGEAMPWHTDACHRFTVVVRGDAIGIEDRATGAIEVIPVQAGLADWDAPTARVHRGVNIGQSTYEEVVVFFLSVPGQDPQPAPAGGDGAGEE